MFLEYIGLFLMCLGAGLSLLSSLGSFRMKDFLSSVQILGVIDSLGLPLVFCGLIIMSEFNLLSLKIFFLIVFTWLLSPTATHVLIRANLISRKNDD